MIILKWRKWRRVASPVWCSSSGCSAYVWSLIDFVKLGVAERLNFFSLPRVDESVLAVLSAVQEWHRYPITLLRLLRTGSDWIRRYPKYFPARAFNDVERYEATRSWQTETPELPAAQAAQRKAELNQSEAETAVMVTLPFFYSQEREDNVVTMPASHSPLSHHLQHQRNLRNSSHPPNIRGNRGENPWDRKRSLQTVKHRRPLHESSRLMPFQSLQVLDVHCISCGRQLPKARWLEAQISQSTTPKALSRTPWNRECDQRPKPSKATALATLPPKMPSRTETLPACSPPPPRPSTSSEVWKVPSLQLEVVGVEERHQWLWCASCTPTTSKNSATSLPWKRSSKTGLPTNSHAWCASKGKQLPK